MGIVTLKDLLGRPDNGFNQVRLLAAVLVVVSHSIMLVFGNGDARPLSWGPYELGGNAVNVFFFLSGLLLMSSLERDSRVVPFALARILRIFPALIIASITTAWILIPFVLMKFAPEYYFDAHAIWYPLDVLWQFEKAHIDDAWRGSTFPNEANVPLWTIKYELLAYALLCVAMAFGVFKTRSVTLLLCMVAGACLTITAAMDVFQGVVGSLLRFSFCFLLGVSAFQYREAIPLSGVAAVLLVALAIPLGLTNYGAPVWIMAFSYGALALGNVPLPVVTKLAQRHDVSYGLYIYSWPIQQLLFIKFGWPASEVGALFHALISLLLAVPVAMLSWLLVEKPAINLGRLLRRRRSLSSHGELA